jgi:hypothetical protein
MLLAQVTIELVHQMDDTRSLPRPHALTLWSNPASAASSGWQRVSKLRSLSRVKKL